MNLKQLIAAFNDAGIVATDDQINTVFKTFVTKTAKPGKVYYFKSAAFGAKTPLQMRQLVLGLKDLGQATVDVWATDAANYLTTKQDPVKIIAFYRKRMLEDGLISLEPTASEEDPADEDDRNIDYDEDDAVDDDFAEDDDVDDASAEDDQRSVYQEEDVDYGEPVIPGEIQSAIEESMAE